MAEPVDGHQGPNNQRSFEGIRMQGVTERVKTPTEEPLHLEGQKFNCNTPAIVWVPCKGCKMAPARYREPTGRLKPLGPHCTTCHSGDHNACHCCGSCLPECPPFAKWMIPGAVRRDRLYCSSACRQRDYRKRKRMKDCNTEIMDECRIFDTDKEIKYLPLSEESQINE